MSDISGNDCAEAEAVFAALTAHAKAREEAAELRRRISAAQLLLVKASVPREAKAKALRRALWAALAGKS